MRFPLLKALHIKKSYDRPIALEILKDISLELHAGQSIAIMGASGEGKSTLLHILGTLEAPTAGVLEICGNDVGTTHPAKLRNQHIGFVFQSFHLLDEHTVLQNVLMPAFIAGKKIHADSPAYERALALLEEVGMIDRAHFHAKFLSGGEKQRVAIARCLCNDPDLILADEPSGNLDHDSSQLIHTLLHECVKGRGKGLIVVTHDKELAASCDKTYILQGGLFHA